MTRAAAIDRKVLRVSGDDATTYLQGQVTQDLAQIADGCGMTSFILQPDGKVVDLVGIHRVGDFWLIDVAEAAYEIVEQRLRRFMFRVAVTLSADDVKVVWWPDGESDSEVLSHRSYGAMGVLSLSKALPDSATWLNREAAEQSRIEQSIPSYGTEITGSTVPAMLGGGVVASAVSFTKGCYTGQELVARLDARGSHVPFHLVRLFAATKMSPGDVLASPSTSGPFGSVTSATLSSSSTEWVGLGFLHRTNLGEPLTQAATSEAVRFELVEGASIFAPR